MEKNTSMDEFWDIEELLPARPAKKIKKPDFADTDAIEISVSDAGKKTNADTGFSIPKREEAKPKEKKILREYEPKQGFLQKVTVSPWPTEFNFYTKFRRDAIRLFEREHEPCEYIYFFSYMPQYDQMTAAQLAYYLYWRGEIRKGIYIKTDINYLFLYTYELLNLPDRVPPKEGAVALSRLWAAYREDFRYLDKYLGEWLCDYCLIHKVEPDWVTLDVFAGEIAAKVAMPEFYLHSGTMTWALISTLSAYDYRKSKYYPDAKESFDTHIPAAVEAIAAKHIAPRLSDYGIESMRMLRDSFSGAVACHDVKFKITVMCTPLRRSAELKQALSGLVKLAENQIRATYGIKSRFLPQGVTEEMKREMIRYFDAVYPDRIGRKKKTAAEREEERYMALYEPKQTGKADISRALAIEEAAWETAELLDTGEDDLLDSVSDMTTDAQERMPEETAFFANTEPIPAEEESEFAFLHAVSEFERGAVLAASEGAFDRYCRASGKMAAMVRDRINEIASEALGDIIIEEDFSLVSDYAEDILTMLGK